MSVKEFFTPAELAALALPDMPTTARAVQIAADKNWRDPAREWSPENPSGLWRKRKGRGGGYEYHFSLLPDRAAMRLRRAAQRGKRREIAEDRGAEQQSLVAFVAWLLCLIAALFDWAGERAELAAIALRERPRKRASKGRVQ